MLFCQHFYDSFCQDSKNNFHNKHITIDETYNEKWYNEKKGKCAIQKAS